jgi:hypothetical protein
MKGDDLISNLDLHNIAHKIHNITTMFKQLNFTHILREHNTLDYDLSKDALLMARNIFAFEKTMMEVY